MDNSRNDLIRDILNAFDTIDNLRFDNRLLRERIERLESTESVEGQVEWGEIDLAVLKAGREKILKDCCEYWRPTVKITFDEDDDKITGITSFQQWRNSYVRKVPDELSRIAFYEYFDTDLRAVYEEEREKALAAVHNEDA